MADSTRESSRIANNRLAVAVVVGSLAVAVVVTALYRAGALEFFVPERGPAADALPLYFLSIVVLVALVVWGWGRLLSWFE